MCGRRISLAVVLIGMGVSQAWSSGKSDDIRKLLKITGALEIGAKFAHSMNAQLSSAMRSVNNTIPDSVFAIMQEELAALVDEAMQEKSGLVEAMCGLYDKYFTHEDIEGLIAFYESEVGRKTIRVMPQLMQESMELGQRWGESMGATIVERLYRRLSTRGIELPEI
jgi:hypothetical protein